MESFKRVTFGAMPANTKGQALSVKVANDTVTLYNDGFGFRLDAQVKE
jgi:hypothetical protein